MNEGDTDSEQEVNEGTGAARKPQKRARGSKGLDEPPVPDLLQSQLAASNYGCLSLLKKRHSGNRPWAVGKRTPRVPVMYSYDKDNEKYNSPLRHGLKGKVDALDDDVTHEIALALAKAYQRGGSPQVSQTPNRKVETSSPVENERMHTETEMTSAKLQGSDMDEAGCELSLESAEAQIPDYGREKGLWKGKSYRGRKLNVEENMENHLDYAKEACSGTEEGQNLVFPKGKLDMETAGKDADFEALQALADLSLSFPEAPVDTGSSVHFEEEKIGTVAKSKLNGDRTSPGTKITSFKATKQGKVSSIPDANEGAIQFNAGMRKRKQKFLPSKISESVEHVDSHVGDSQKAEARDEASNFVNKGKRAHDAAYPKQGKLMKPTKHTSSSNDHGRESNDSAPSSIQALSACQFNLPTKVRSRCKKITAKPLIRKDSKSSENVVDAKSNIAIPSSHDGTLNLKEKLSNCLSWYQVQRWCVFEWFYSAIDYPWFAKREFMEYLEHAGLGHIPRLTQVEWGVIRSSLGKPRRFSEQYLKEEKEKLNQYRESVRKHYSELRAGTRDGLPTDLAQPLSVGQRIIALHPRTREIHDGSVLTVDHSRYRVQFDHPELGVEFVMDVDCMPLNPLENMPASFGGHNLTLNRYIENLNDLKMNGQPVERKIEGQIKFPPCENLENTSGLSHPFPPVSNLLRQAKGGLVSSNAQVIVGLGETVKTPQAANAQPAIVAQIHAKEADIQALSELTRALDKKGAVVSELKHMNDEVLANEKDGENSIKDSEPFKKHYAAVLLQLNEVNEQVSSALFCLRQRNTYQGNAQLMWSKPMASTVESVGHSGGFDPSMDDTQGSGSHVAEIVESSRTKAHTMVDAAMQAMSSLKKERNSIDNIEEAIDFINTRLSADNLSPQSVRSSVPANSVHATLASQHQLSSCTENVGATNHASDTESNNLCDQNEAQIPLELISQCVATLLMIQRCTERQFPPGDIAQVLDFAVTGLKPYCSQNLPVYAEIQKYMGIIRNQILALIPT